MMPGCQVKICGITNLEDAAIAASAGADYLGVVVEVPFSPRSVTIEQAEEIFSALPLPGVALVYEMPSPRLRQLIDRLKPEAVQFLSPAGEVFDQVKERFPRVKLWQSIHLPPVGGSFDRKTFLQQAGNSYAAGADVIVLDTAAVINGEKRFGGTGRQSDWRLARELVQSCRFPVFLAGGINPHNVREAIDTVNPAGIDLCSGVEASPGKKSAEKVRALMEAVKGKGCRV